MIYFCQIQDSKIEPWSKDYIRLKVAHLIITIRLFNNYLISS